MMDESQQTKINIPYEASPYEVVDVMLDMAKVGEKDTLIDLGCGDGRIVFAAARRGAAAIGVDRDPQWIEKCNVLATKNTKFCLGEIEDANLSEATIITVYGNIPDMSSLAQVIKKLKNVKVVSHNYPFPAGWNPIEQRNFIVDKVSHWVYLYEVNVNSKQVIDTSLAAGKAAKEQQKPSATKQMFRRLRYWIFGRPKAKSIGVFYIKNTKKIHMVRVPDYEDELDDPYIQEGSAFLRLPIEFAGKPVKQTLSWYVSEAEKVI